MVLSKPCQMKIYMFKLKAINAWENGSAKVFYVLHLFLAVLRQYPTFTAIVVHSDGFLRRILSTDI